MNVIPRLSSTRALLVGTGALLLGLGAFGMRAHARAGMERWVLEADRDRNCYYGSSFNEGDLYVPPATHQPLQFTHHYEFEDGCTWEAVETLVPDGPDRFHYEYDEEPISCLEGHEPNPACPLSGSVTVIPAE